MTSLLKGFTLLEMLVTLLILSVLLSLSIPSLGFIIQQRRGEMVMKNFADVISLARTTAIMGGSVVTFCPSSNNVDCGGDWQQNSIVFSDRNMDRTINQDDRLIRSMQIIDLAGTITWKAFQNKPYLQFDPAGFTRNQNGNFTFCPHDKMASNAQQLIINRSGRTRFALDTDHDGIREGSSGQPLKC